jgi:hypothetical protein
MIFSFVVRFSFLSGYAQFTYAANDPAAAVVPSAKPQQPFIPLVSVTALFGMNVPFVPTNTATPAVIALALAMSVAYPRRSAQK